MSGLYLYATSLIHATGITGAINGQFTGKKQQEILVARGSVLELFRVDINTNKVRFTTANTVNLHTSTECIRYNTSDFTIPFGRSYQT